MPIIARLDKIILKMYFRQKEHNPPHIHALSGDCMGMFSLIDGEMFENCAVHSRDFSHELTARFY